MSGRPPARDDAADAADASERLRASALRHGRHRSVATPAIADLLRLGGGLFLPGDEAARTAQVLLARLAARGLPSSDGRLDPTEVINLMIADGLEDESGFWRSHYVATGRRLTRDLCGGDIDMAGLPPKRFALSFRRTFALGMANPGTRLRLRLPLPIEDAHLTDLAVTVDDSPAEVAIAPGRIEVRLVADGAPQATVAVGFRFTAHAGLPHGAAPTPGERATWLAAREGPIQVTQRVRALAGALGGGTPDDRVGRFRAHLLDDFTCGPVHPDRIAPLAATDWALEERRYDCRIGAALLVALCRACDIPARLVGGYLLWAAPTEHYWAEIWLPDRGWTPQDLLAWDLSAGGRDATWRAVHDGRVDYRMKTQLFPHIFTGAPGIAMPPAWQRLSRAIAGGTETRLVAIPDGAPLYTDEIRILEDSSLQGKGTDEITA